MTNTPANQSRDLLSSRDSLLEIHLLSCNHGDTILIRLPEDRWCLVDCNLTSNDGVLQSFFDFIESKGVSKLDFIVQTHPDWDHYNGMKKVLEYFIKKSGKIGIYIDSGINAKQAQALLQNRPGGSHYAKLQESLERWHNDGLLSWKDLDAGRFPVSPRGFRGQVDFIPIGPDPEEKRRLINSDLRRLASNSKARPETNALSIVIVLSVNIEGKNCNVLLGADADSVILERALDVWDDYASRHGVSTAFDIVKVPHHGSINSQSARLCKAKKAGNGSESAAISAGTRKGLPDRRIIKNYLDEDWVVTSTTTRRRTTRPTSPMSLSDRSALPVDYIRHHSIHISWTPESGLSIEPEAAKITAHDLPQYDEAERGLL